MLGVSVKLEAEAAQLPSADRAELLEGLGLGEGALPRVAQAAYRLLGRRTFFTTGDKESRAWTFRAGRQGARVRRRDPFRPPAWLHPGRGRALGRAPQAWGPGRRLATSASCVSRARITKSWTVMSSRSASTSEGPQAARPAGVVVVATPIGNLGDLSPRAVAALASAGLPLLRGHPQDAEAAEPRRHLGAAPRLASPLQRGGHDRRPPSPGRRRERLIAIVTDAGTPLVSDPGARLGTGGARRGHPVEVVPGPFGALGRPSRVRPCDGAVVLRGFPASFRAHRARERLAAVAAETDRAVVIFESPHRAPAARWTTSSGVRTGAAGGGVPGADQAPRGGLALRPAAEAAERARSVKPRGEYVVVGSAAL